MSQFAEFLNRYFVEYFNSKPGVQLTRSRAYRKNDNCHVEQKNFTHVRETFGYDRIDNKELIKYMNEIYRDYLNPLLNFFTPQLKLVEKSRVGSRYRRKYDIPKTPYQRLMDSEALSVKQKYEFQNEYEKHNPIELKKGLSRKLSTFRKLLEGFNLSQSNDNFLEGYDDVRNYVKAN